jgi:tetratricopeptide (TPR) repeat protein
MKKARRPRPKTSTATATADGVIPTGERERKLLLVAVVLAVVVPMLHLYFNRDNPTFETPIIDSAEYIDFAKEALLPRPASMAYFHSPLYSWFIALLFSLFGFQYTLIRLTQPFLNALTCLTLYALGYRLFSRRVAEIAAFGWVFYAPVIFFTGEILNVPWILLLNTLALYLVIRAWPRPAPGAWLLAGAVTGLAAITRADILVFAYLIGALLLYESWRASELGRVGWKKATAFAVGVAAPLIVVGIRNYRVCDQFVMLPVNSGINFYLGNNPDYKKTIAIRPGVPYEAVKNMPQAEGVPADPRQPANSPYFYDKAFKFMRSDPKGYLGCVFFKIRTLLSGIELPETFDLYTYRAYSPVLYLLSWRIGGFAFPFGVLLPLAALGAWSERRRIWETRWLWIFLASMVVPLIGYWNSSRYRMALVPGLMLFGAAAIVRLLALYRSHAQRELVRSIGVAVALAVVFNWPYEHFTLHHRFDAEMYGFAGMRQIRLGDKDRALPLLQHAVELDPQSVEIQAGIGYLLMESDRPQDGIPHLETAVHLHPEHAYAWNNLGIAYGKLGRLVDAKHAFDQAIRLDPNLTQAQDNMKQVQQLMQQK